MVDLIDEIKSFGADNISIIKTSEIRFEPTLIELCKMNSCGNYGKNWTCPPYVGETDKLIEKAREYDDALVFQAVYKLEDSFDIEGMDEGNRLFRVIVDKVAELCKPKFSKMLVLSAGGCRICEKCAVVDNAPCRFPDKAYASLESYSIQVSSLAEACGMKYINGQNTATYFGAILF